MIKALLIKRIIDVFNSWYKKHEEQIKKLLMALITSLIKAVREHKEHNQTENQ